MYKNIFISQPMTGRSEEEILATRQREIEKIHQLFDADGEQVNINWDIFWLSQSLERLAMADIIWLCDGWEYSNGCNIELECATRYGVGIMYPESTLKRVYPDIINKE